LNRQWLLRGRDPWRGSFEKKEQVRLVRQKALNQLIEEKLIDSEIKKVGTKLLPKELDAAIEDIRRRNGLTQEELERYLEREGMTSTCSEAARKKDAADKADPAVGEGRRNA